MGKRIPPVSVHFKDRRREKLVRMAAVQLDTSRSEFLVEAGIEKARAVLKLNREEDFLAALAALDDAA